MIQKIFGHRGASGQAPENTLEAFELAAKMGAQGVELDVHFSRDGALVVTHDERIERVSDGSGFVQEHTLKELKAHHFNRTHPEYRNARIPTLEEVFGLLAPTGLEINIELKNSWIPYPGLEERVLETAAAVFDLRRVIFSSFSHASMMRMKQLAPEVRCGLRYDASMVKPWVYALMLGMDAIHPVYTEVITPGGECAQAHRAGIRVNTWTVNNPEEIRKVLLEGADIVITNVPDVALSCLSGMSEKTGRQQENK